MAVLTITIGIPGSGKTTWAKEECRRRPGLIRANRDDLRFALFAAYVLDPAGEEIITAAQHAAIAAALKAGTSVIVDDTNLRWKFRKQLHKLAADCDAAVVEKPFDIDVNVAIKRDAARDRVVGEDVIRKMYKAFVQDRRDAAAGKHVYVPNVDHNVTPYVPVSGTPKAIIVDVDGTLAKMDGRSPFDWSRVLEDKPNTPVIEAVKAAAAAGYKIIVCSGRDGVCKADTEVWMQAHNVPYDHFFIRPVGDSRKDSIIKTEIFDAHIRGQYDVHYVLDDRNQVVDMWRALGIACFQVAPGDF